MGRGTSGLRISDFSLRAEAGASEGFLLAALAAWLRPSALPPSLVWAEVSMALAACAFTAASAAASISAACGAGAVAAAAGAGAGGAAAGGAGGGAAAAAGADTAAPLLSSM